MARIPFLLGQGDLHPLIFSIVLMAPVLLALSEGPGSSSSFLLLLVYHLQQVAYLSLALDSLPHVNKPVHSVSQEIFFVEGSTSKWVALSVKNCNYYEVVAAATYNRVWYVQDYFSPSTLVQRENRERVFFLPKS